jgi:hypothetical protein
VATERYGDEDSGGVLAIDSAQAEVSWAECESKNVMA